MPDVRFPPVAQVLGTRHPGEMAGDAEMKTAITAVLAILAFSVTVPALALLYFLSDNPFEFTDPYCDHPDDAPGVWNIVASGCLDAGYVAQFIGIYGLTIFIPSLILFGALRFASRARKERERFTP